MALPFLPGAFHRSEPTFHNRKLLEHLTEYEVRKLTGIPRNEVRFLFNLLQPLMQHKTNRGHAIPAETQVLTALSFFRSGSFQYIEGSLSGISQSSASRLLENFCSEVIQKLLPRSIRFPTDLASLNQLKMKFFDKNQFPNIVGIVDGTHVNLKAPFDDENTFVNRKNHHSINVQVVCGPDNEINDAVVKWPGSTHDNFMWRKSSLRRRFEADEFGASWLLGDSGYGLERFLLTPFPNPATTGEKNYNSAFKSTRSLVERSIGVWKSRFRSMDQSGGILCYSPAKVCKLISTSLVLHNYCIRNRVPLLPDDQQYLEFMEFDDEMIGPHHLMDVCGVATRENVVRNYFDV